MHSFETKKGKVIALPSGTPDTILDIDVTPNRSHDCFSHLGIAKEISALFSLPLKKSEKLRRPAKAGIGVPTEASGEKADAYLKLDVQEPELCRRYIAGIMLDIKVGPSPIWLRERLIAVGQKPINNIVDAANYVMLEMGQPLHAFDMDKIKPVKIIVRRAQKGEKITTLDNKNYELDESMLLIADSKMPLAIAGIKGGKKAEIDKKTKNIIIEAANFEPANIRSTSQKLGLATGASAGFENGISPNIAPLAMRRVIDLIWEIAGGKVVSEWIDFYPKKVAPSRISFKVEDVRKLLGVDVSKKEIISILNRLGIKAKKGKEGTIIADCPLERLDLEIKEDIIEEIARIYGYGKIPATLPEGILIPAKRNDGYFYGNIIRDILVGAGFSEVYNYSLGPTGEIEIENPIALDKKYLRANLLEGLKNNVRNNFKYFDEVRIFEIGKIFRKSEKGIEEKNALAGIAAHKIPKKSSDELTEIKGVVEMLLSKLGISDFWFDDVKEGTGLPKIADIKIGDDIIGILDLNAFEIDLDKLINLINEEVEYRPISKYPAVIRDIAILVPFETKMTEVLDIIENTGGELLVDTDLFDIYEGEDLGESRKSFAFHLIFQSAERTLSDKEVNSLMEKIIKALEENEKWEVRK